MTAAWEAAHLLHGMWLLLKMPHHTDSNSGTT
jgi:hypothetical protein